MRPDKIVLSLGVITLVLVMVLATGVAYAFETDNIIRINDKPTSSLGVKGFNVAFLNNVKTMGDGKTTVTVTSDTTAVFEITGLSKVGDLATAILTIKNNSRDFFAELNATVTNTNTEYFKATVLLSDDVIEARNGKATVELTVELIKLPILNDVDATIEANIVATPVVEK